MNPEEHLRMGISELEPFLILYGFQFTQTASGRGSGGYFASGEYRRCDRFLELHFRGSLGLVSYHVGSGSLGHEEYVRAVRAVDHISEGNVYPGFFDDSIAEFRALGEDLRRFGRRFLTGADEQFRELESWVKEHPKPIGFAALR